MKQSQHCDWHIAVCLCQVALGDDQSFLRSGEEWWSAEAERVRQVLGWLQQQIGSGHPLHSTIHFGINKMGRDRLLQLEDMRSRFDEIIATL